MSSKKPVYVLFLVVALLAGCTSPKSVSVKILEPEYWPTSGWKSSMPEAQGMDSDLLAQMLEDISANGTRIHSVLVIRNGYMVTEAYFHPYARDTKIHIQSVTKSVIGMLVGKAISDGYIKNENEKLLDFYPNRIFENPSSEKSSIRLKHLLSMSSGLECQEFSGSGPSMEQTQGWIQFMLDRPMTSAPGKVFGYCNGNAHLLSSILEKTTGTNAREYANQELFEPLGISPVDEGTWWNDPQKITIAGYGLHLTPVDMAKLAFLDLHNGKWEDEQILPADWIADSTTPYVQKEDGSGYGYLWTIYPEAGHYAALGLGGQQIHVYPSRNLIVIVTASLESYAEAPEIENMLTEYILPAIQSEEPLADNPDGYARLHAQIEIAANPVRPVPELPAAAFDNSNQPYTFGENAFGWETLQFVFEPDQGAATITMNDVSLQVGLDNLFRSSATGEGYEMLLRGRWVDEQTFVIDYPYSLGGIMALGDLAESEFRFTFMGDKVHVTAEQLVFGGEPMFVEGSR